MREGWKEVTVEEVADVVSGATPKTGEDSFWGGDIPWLTPKDLAKNPSRYTSAGERTITKAGLASCSAQLLPVGAVLLSSRAPVGYVSVAAAPIATNQGFKSLILKEGQLPEFWYYLLGHSKEYLEAHSGGSTFKELSGSTLKALRFRVPPLEEQQRIVSLIGSLDDAIEAADQAAQAAREAADQLQESLLTPTDGWQHTRLDKLARVRRGATWSKDQESATQMGSCEPVVGIAVTSGDGRLDLSKMKFVAGLKDTVTRLAPLDVLMVMSNGNPSRIGNVYLVDDRLAGMPFSAFQMSIRTTTDAIDPEFLFYILNSRSAQEEFTAMTAGSTGLRNLNLSKVNAFGVSCPEKALQKDIVDKLKAADGAVERTRDVASSLRAARAELLTVLLSGEHEIPESYDLDIAVLSESAA